MFKQRALAVATTAWACAIAGAQELRDPMRPFVPGASPPAAVEQRYRLSATLVSDSRRVAIVNGQPTSVGGRVDGAEVVTVDSSSVELRVGSRTFTVSLSRGASRGE